MLKLRRILPITGLVLLIFIGWQSFTPAQSLSNLESRVSNLATENTLLRSRVSQLEAQVARLSSNARVEYTPPAEGTGPLAPSALAEDPTFKRLATLVIELGERVTAVEAQVARLTPGQ
jgi:hypothetical protein